MSSLGLAQKAPLRKKKSVKREQIREVKSIAFGLFRLIFFAVILGSLASLAISIYFRVGVTKNSFYTSDLQERIAKEKVVKEKLEAKLAFLRSPQRIEQVATTKLGMVKPRSISYLVLTPSEKKLSEVTQNRKELEISLFDRFADALAQSSNLTVKIREFSFR